MTHAEPTPDDVLAAVAQDREQLLKALIENEARRPRPSQHERYEGWLRRYRWWVEDETGTAIASGRALTQKAATRRKHRAYLRELNR